ncbi:hypothetical protein FM105_13095 [Brevibacterium yomogidense]|uniref:Uncharacterized protein n=1 Tax=Brevibacterium yomogidense TaxID=946573 RepID=A0A1X6XN96_9MICO|nr:hypothetical protein FM105_13095 [Brevibacterium yomogidense]
MFPLSSPVPKACHTPRRRSCTATRCPGVRSAPAEGVLRNRRDRVPDAGDLDRVAAWVRKGVCADGPPQGGWSCATVCAWARAACA